MVGLVLHFWGATSITFEPTIAVILAGLLLLVVSLTLSLWSAVSFGTEAMATPNTLRTGGPYKYTRNPMYLGWSLVIVGAGLLTGSWWLLAAAPVATAVTQWRFIASEERILSEQFGKEYENYRRAVPRWLWPL